jgi:hypothetical protein
MDPTKRSTSVPKTQTVLQSVNVLPNSTYYYRMEANHYVYRPYIRLVLVIA